MENFYKATTDVSAIIKTDASPVFCSKCGESCYADGHNFTMISINTTFLPTEVRNKIDGTLFHVCYPCFISDMIGRDVRVYTPGTLVFGQVGEVT
jgi:hypothetical protein